VREIAKWVVLFFIAAVALSPIFEVFDKTDGLAQDGSDLARYVLWLFCFLVFSLRRTVITSGLTSFFHWIIGPSPLQRPSIETRFSRVFFEGTKGHGLFLTFHDLRI
jgi:hypothetical protein